MSTSETIKFKDRTYEFTWTEGGDIPTQNVSQVSGYIFNEKGEMLIVKNDNWTIPGGHPEAGESNLETLKREVLEEAMVEIDNIQYLGSVTVVDIETKETKYQLRFTALVLSIHDFKEKFETSERVFVDPKNLTSYIPWASGKVFSAEVQAAVSCQS